MDEKIKKINNRGRPKTKSFIKRLIYEKALVQKNTPRQALAVELVGLIEKMGEKPLSEDTIIKWISDARSHPKSPLDEQWNIGKLAENDLPPETLPIVLVLSIHLRKFQTFTIRHAKWAARLCRTIHNWGNLASMVIKYSTSELICEITHTPFDSTDLDLELYTLVTGKEISDEQRKSLFAGEKVGDCLFSPEVLIDDIEQMQKLYRELSAQGSNEEDVEQKLVELRAKIRGTKKIEEARKAAQGGTK